MKVSDIYGRVTFDKANEGDSSGDTSNDNAGGTADDTGDDKGEDKGDDKGEDKGTDSALGGGGEGDEDKGSALGGASDKDSSGKKDDEGDASDSDSDGNADGEGSGAPEAYQDFTFPEGVKLEEAMMADFAAWAKENNISQANAQKLVDINSEAVKRVSEDGKKANDVAIKKMTDTWIQAQKDHPEYGGAAHKESVATARLAVEKLGGAELRETFDKLGVGEHPVLFNAFVRLGNLMKDDTIDLGDAAKELSKDDRIKRLYPNSNLQ